MTRRSNLFIAFGLAVFVLGSAIVLLVVRGDDDAAGADTGGDVAVLVATQDIPAGTAGADMVGLVQARRVPSDKRADDALSAASQLGGRVLGTQLRAGEQVRASTLRAETLRGGSIKIPDGKQGIAVQVPFVQGVAGYVGPGDMVNVYANFTKSAPLGAGLPHTKLLLSNVEVLDVSTEVAPRRAAAQPGERPSGSQITYLLALDAMQAERLIYSNANETLYLTLVPEGQAPSATPGHSAGNILR